MPLNPLQTAAPRAPGVFDPSKPPQPYETSRRSSRPSRAVFVPQLTEPERLSNRTTLIRKPEDRSRASEACALPQVRVAHKEEHLFTRPSAPTSERRSLASSIFFPRGADAKSHTGSPGPTTTTQQPTDYFTSKLTPSTLPVASQPPKKELLPQPIETSRRSNRKPSPLTTTTPAVSNDLPPTPPAGPPSPPRFVPVPVETTYRTNRPLARPLVTQPAEEAPKSNLHRKPDMHIDLSNLPQPVSTSRWTNRIRPGQRHLRRSSTVQPPGTPGVYYFVPATGQSSATPNSAKTIRGPGKWVRPVDHVSHLHEPVDSAPPSPAGSPGSSRCPSLSSSPTSTSPPTSAASSSWEVNKQLGFRGKGGIAGRRESFEDGYAGYMLDLQRRARERSSGSSTSSEGSEKSSDEKQKTPVTATAKDRRESEADGATDSEIKYMRAKARGETLKPPMKIQIPTTTTQQQKVYDQYPIFASPTRERFLPSPQRVPTPELRPPPTAAKPKPVPTQTHQGGYGPPPNQPAVLSLGGFRIPVLRVMYSNPIVPSPGITVASLPPRSAVKTKTAGVPEDVDDVTEEFVKEVWNYLSLDHECIARKYDEELAEYTGATLEAVKKNRFAVLTEYVKAWVGQNPQVEGGEHVKGGLW